MKAPCPPTSRDGVKAHSIASQDMPVGPVVPRAPPEKALLPGGDSPADSSGARNRNPAPSKLAEASHAGAGFHMRTAEGRAAQARRVLKSGLRGS